MNFWSSAQNLTQVKVVQEINYGSVNLYIFENSKTNLYYKSSSSSQDILDVGDLAELDLTIENNNKPVYLDGAISRLIAKKIQSPINKEGGFDLTNNIIHNLPYQDKDVLFFENSQHITDLTELLYTQEDIDIALNDNLQDSSILFAFEANYPSFKSFRLHLEDKYAEQEIEGYSEEELREYYEYDHINDDALKSFFNKNRLIGIGDSVYYYHNTNEVLKFHSNYLKGYVICNRLSLLNKNKNPINNFRGTLLIDRNLEVLTEIYNPYQNKASQTITDPNNSAKVIVHESRVYTDHPPANCENTSGIIVITVEAIELPYTDINTFPMVYYDQKTYPVYLGNRTVTLEIKWKGASSSGSDLQVISNYNGKGVEHNFVTPGTYDVITRMQYTDTVTQEIVILEDITSISVSGLGCTVNEDWEHGSAQSSSWRLEGKVWTSNNIFGKHVGSYSHAFQLKRGKWKRRRITINTRIRGQYRNEQCAEKELKTGFKSRNSRRVRKVKSRGFARYSRFSFGNEDVRSEHRIDSKGLSFKLSLKPCL